MKFYPIKEEFPNDILCPLCIHSKECDEKGEEDCKTILAMCDDMEDTDGSFLV